jgi:hypothetical protein
MMGSEFDYTYGSSPDGRYRDINEGLYQKFYIVTPVEDIDFTIGAEDSEVVEVQVQVVDPAGDPMEQVFSLRAFVTDGVDGGTVDSFTTGTWAATTGAIQVNTLEEDLTILTDDTGLAVFDVTDSGNSAETRYLAVQLPGGAMAVSSAIVFETQ